MSDDQPPSSNGPRTGGWLRRLTQSFSDKPRDREELVQIFRDAERINLFDADARSMLEGVLEVSESQVRDVMIPRSQMVVVERDAALDDILPVILESGHSRFPVIGEDRDEVVGVLLAKDLLRYVVEHRERDFDIRECLRPASIIPESKRLNVLLNEFRTSHNHMAIVVDEYSGVSGLLTIEDVLEEIVGEIDDEHDIEEDLDILEEGPNVYAVRALTRIEDFNDYFSVEFSDEDYDTIGGMVMHALGRLPRRGESVSSDGFEFKVIRADRRRVETLQVTAPADLAAKSI